MIQYIDHRALTAAYLTSDGRLLLNDEPLPDEFPTARVQLVGWDVELKIFDLTGARGGQLPSDPDMREALRASILAAANSPLQAIVMREARLREAADAYVNQIPIMTDASYDAEWRIHRLDRREKPWLFDVESPRCLFPAGTILDQVGAAPPESSGFARVKHGNPMKSINDVFEGDGASQYDELLAFVREMEIKLGNHAWPMIVEPKVDGMAVKLIYRNGLLALGVTRGDGAVGDDITDNIRISGIAPQSITPDEPWNGTQAHPLNADPLEIIGEVYMPLKDFTAANIKRVAAGKDAWANARNAASGSMKLLDAAELRERPLAFVRHDGYTPFIEGLHGVVQIQAYNWTELVEAVETVRNSEHVFAIDGAVVKLVEGHGRDVLGIGTRAPNWACAFKFKPEQVTTILEGIDVQVGRTGVLAPVARLKPVLVDGTTVSNATLNNEAWIQEKDLQIGDTVVLQKAGAIIPEIASSETLRARQEVLYAYYGEEHSGRPPSELTAMVHQAIAKERPPFSLVDHLGGKCPCCGSTDLQKQEVQKGEGAKWCCVSNTCPAQLSARVEHFCSRGCLDIEGVGEEASIAIAEALGVAAAMGVEGANNPLYLFQWTVGDLMILTWVTGSGGQMTFGESRATKAIAALGRAKSLPLHRWIRALGIRSIGEETSKEISRLFPSAKLLLGMGQFNVDPSVEDVVHAVYARYTNKPKDFDAEYSRYQFSPRLGPDSARRLADFMCSPEGFKTVETLAAWNVTSDNYDPVPTASDAKPLFGKSFAITGTLSVNRDEMKALIESKGGKVSGSVSKNTNYLVAGDGGGQKADKARAAGVTILDEAALRAML